jgi:hypothetical protein
MIRLVAKARVRVLTFDSHTTQVFQVLVNIIFDVPKRCLRHELPFDDDNAIVKVIMKVYHDFTRTMIWPNVWETFYALGPQFDMKREPYGLLFDEGKLRKAVGYQGCGPLTFPWTSYSADDILLSSVGSRILTKST